MSSSANVGYDALLVVSFGGPEKKEDVIPFLENVLRGKPVPRGRLLEVAEHYYQFDGVSPINAQVRELIDALRMELARAEISLPIYWGNRNWNPMLSDRGRQIKNDGVRRALAFVTSAYASYSGCRQYRENIEQARGQTGTEAPQIDKIRAFYNHPQFIAANADLIRAAMDRLPLENRSSAHLAFTAHSIPLAMSSNCDYVAQLNETCQLIAESLDFPSDRWRLTYQSRSGRPNDPWLEPDIADHVHELKTEGISAVVVAPIGFLSDHIEVLFDLDLEVKAICAEAGITMTRSATVGTHPAFVECIRELIEERLGRRDVQRSIGRFGPYHDVCPSDCCQYTVPTPTQHRVQ